MPIENQKKKIRKQWKSSYWITKIRFALFFFFLKFILTKTAFSDYFAVLLWMPWRNFIFQHLQCEKMKILIKYRLKTVFGNSLHCERETKKREKTSNIWFCCSNCNDIMIFLVFQKFFFLLLSSDRSKKYGVRFRMICNL